MRFADLPAGETIFLDANTLVYHFQPHPTFGLECNQLIARIEHQDVPGYTSTHILSEVAHRLMIVEASAQPSGAGSNVKRRLQQNPAVIQGLSLFRTAIESVLNSRIQILTISPTLVLTAVTISQSTGLLSNDALLVAVMRANSLTNIASHDTDFDRVPGLTRFAPA